MAVEMEEGFRIEMAEHIKAEKELQVKLGVLEERMKVPEEKLAKARILLLKAKEAYEKFLEELVPLRSEKTLLEGELQLLQEKKSALRQEAALARGGAGMRPGTQAFVEQMNELAGDAAEAQMKKEVRQADAEAALAALKNKMGS